MRATESAILLSAMRTLPLQCDGDSAYVVRTYRLQQQVHFWAFEFTTSKPDAMPCMSCHAQQTIDLRAALRAILALNNTYE